MSNTSSKDSSTAKKKTSTNPHRTSASYEETIIHGKKRKVWRSTGNSSANMMSPEAAANYLQQAAEAAAAAAAAAGSGGESVQITLGPNGIAAHATSAGGMESLHWMNSYAALRSGGTTTGGILPSPIGLGTTHGMNYPLSGMGVNMNMNVNLTGGHPTSVSFGGLDLAALARAGDLSALTSAAARSNHTVPFPTSGFGTNMNLNATMGSATAGPTPGSFTRNGMTITPMNSSSAPLATSTTMAGNKIGTSNNVSVGPGSVGGGKESLPCSEAEMKALMSMFVEIMGMSMDTEKLGKSTAAKKQAARAKKNGSSSSSSNLFSFGDDKNGVWPDPAIAAATGDLDALNAHCYAYSDDEENDDDSLPALDDMNEIKRQSGDKKNTPGIAMKTNSLGSAVALISNASGATPITGRAGIAPVEWESLEQVAIEDAMEAEERARKAAKRREKKNRKKEKARKEAAAKAAEVASRRREKAILSWRSRVVSACQSNEIDKLKILLDESPLTSMNCSIFTDDDGTPAPAMTMATMTPHLEFLLPHTVAKNRTVAERTNEARTLLASYVMNTNLTLVFTTPLRTGRTAFHTACLYGELNFVESALHLAQQWTQEGELSTLPPSYLSTTCQESGFAPIHYAVLSGSKAVLETLLKAGADVKLKSTDTHTWKSSNGKGISSRELAEALAHGSQDKVLETHGLALQEALGHFSSSSDERRKYRAVLNRMVERLKDVEQHGYTPPPPEPEPVEETAEEPEVLKATPATNISVAKGAKDDTDSDGPEIVESLAVEDGNSNKNGKKKKKKKKKGEQATELVGMTSSTEENGEEQNSARTIKSAAAAQDPLVTALLGMGFTEEQISAAVKACGGTDRATADDLVVWILGEGSGEASSVATVHEPSRQEATPVVVAAAATPAPVPAVAKPKVKVSSPAVLETSTREINAAAKKEEEERLKEQRLAAKREEKIRRNREWNNRAQARQKEEEEAKLAQAVAEANRVASQRAAQVAAVQQQLQFQQQLQQQQVQQQFQQQAQQHFQQQAQQQFQKAQQLKPETAPQQVLAPASAFFPGRVANTASMMPPPHVRTPAQTMGMSMPLPAGHFGVPPLPLQTSVFESHVHGLQNLQSTTGNVMAASTKLVDSQKAAQPRVHPQVYDNSSYNPLQPTGMPKMPLLQSWEPQNSHGQMYNTEIQYTSIADDSTVSSYGSGRVPAPPSFSATIPPGFRVTSTPSALPPPVEETTSVTSFEVEENPLGEMRATAREFVPTNFTSRPSSRNNSTLRHPSSLPTTSESPVPSRLPGFSGSEIAATQSSMQSNGLLGGVNSFGSSLLVTGHHLGTMDRLPSVPSEHFSPVPPSAASSVTGISHVEEPQFPVLGLGLDKGSSDVVSRAPAMLETIASGLASSSFDGTGATNGSSIWGSISSSSVGGGNTTGTLAGIPLTGLPSLSLASGGSTGSTLGPRSDGVLSGDSILSTGFGGASGWGNSTLGGGSTTGGSIW